MIWSYPEKKLHKYLFFLKPVQKSSPNSAKLTLGNKSFNSQMEESTMKKKVASGIFFTVAVLSALGISQVFAGERPPADSKPLVEIIQTLETQGYAPITEISMDDGVWEVEAYKNNEERELRVNPLTGEILSDRKDN